MRNSQFFKHLHQQRVTIGKFFLLMLLMPQFTLGQDLESTRALPVISSTPQAITLPTKMPASNQATANLSNNNILNTQLPDSSRYKTRFTFNGYILPKIGVPITLIGFALTGFGKRPLLEFNEEVDEGVVKYFIGFHTKIDNYTRHIPIVATYGLNLAGIKGKHDVENLTALFGLSNFVSRSITKNIKSFSQELRPDHSSSDAFPSGHTTSAFMNATIMYLEYKDRSIWYGVGGYAVATATGTLRLLNRRHWLSDVAAGAGVGILSTQAVYAVYPWLQRKIGQAMPQWANSSLHITPAFENCSVGVGMIYSLEKLKR